MTAEGVPRSQRTGGKDARGLSGVEVSWAVEMSLDQMLIVLGRTILVNLLSALGLIFLDASLKND